MTVEHSSRPEQERIVASRIGESRYPAESSTILEQFAAIVSQFPDREAMRTADSSCTYDELDRLSNRAADAVLADGADGVDPVVLISGRGVSAISGILGILKAGKFYVPLDLSLPPQLLREHLGAVGASLILTDAQHAELARQIAPSAIRIVNLDKIGRGFSDSKTTIRRSPGDLVCVTYSSGSTGKPKGVIQTNRTVMRMAFDSTSAGRLPNLRVAQQAPFAYTWSIFEIFGTLLAGSTLCPFDVRKGGFYGLERWLREFRIGRCGFAPTVFRVFCKTLSSEKRFPDCRFLYLGGSAITVQDIDLYRRHFSRDTLLATSLSSSEAGNITSYFIDHDVPSIDPVPAGYANPGIQISIVDADRADVAPGEIGEIAVTSPYLSPGYWRNDELTQERFSPVQSADRPRTYYSGDRGFISEHGCLTFTGRADNLVKVNARFVDLENVEAALLDIGVVEQAAVIVDRGGQTTGERLVAYVVTKSGSSPSPHSLRIALAERLPSFMIPSLFVFRDDLPLTQTNKIDRNRLSSIPYR